MRFLKISLALLLVAALGVSMSGCFFDDVTKETIDVPGIASSDEYNYYAKLDEVIELLDEYYVDGYDKEHLGDFLASAAVAATGDRWSYYVSAEDAAAFQESNANAYVGIGVTVQVVGPDDARLKIVKVNHNSPAEKAGLINGDIVSSVDGESTADLGLDGTKNKIRGEEGTDVTLTIEREKKNMDIKVMREVIKVPVVISELLEDDIGYIKINNFDERCAEETIGAIEALRKQGASALVFDVRFNPGGRKDELVKILDYLLPEGPLFRSVDYQGNESVDNSDEKCLKMPMAVLVNGESYSAAEFFAAALQEYDWATVVGTQTCGKANYQITYPLSDGSFVAISSGHYQTPHGVTLTDVGVTPDIVVEVDDQMILDLYYEKIEKTKDKQLQAAISAVKQ